MALKEEIQSLILLGAEGEYWDFKEKWHDYYTDDGEDCWTQWEC